MGGDRAAGHRGMGFRDCFDFLYFDAESADLELGVDAAEVFELAVSALPHPVAGAVHAAAGRTVRIGNEPVRGLVGAAQVASRDLDAGQVEFAGHPDRHRLQRVVEDADGAGDGRPTVVSFATDPRARPPCSRWAQQLTARVAEGAQAAPQVLGQASTAEEVRYCRTRSRAGRAGGGGEVEVVDAVAEM